jgi:hypothetical protein
MYGGPPQAGKKIKIKVRLHWLVLDRRKAVVGNRVGNDTRQKELEVVIVTVYDTTMERDDD